MSTCKQKAIGVIDRLKAFNRKERDHLVKFAFCQEPRAPELADGFWKMISDEPIQPKPKQLFFAMDYHLNWLFAAILTAADEEKDLQSKTWDNKWKVQLSASEKELHPYPVKGNQQDVDFLVVWFSELSNALEIVLVEAKLDSAWDSDQFKSKKTRLDLIKRVSEKSNLGLGVINWRLLLVSPKDQAPSSKEFNVDLIKNKQDWMLDDSHQLWHRTLPVPHNLQRVTRTEKNKNGGYDCWKIVGSVKSNENDGPTCVG
jgi:hypothetical protein